MNHFYTKILLLCSTVLASFPLLAAGKTSLVVGVSGGYAKRTGDLAVSLGYNDPQPAYANIPNTFVVDHASDNGAFLGGLLGYQLKCDHWLFGAEFSADTEHFAKTQPFAFSDASAQAGGVGFGWNGTFHYERKMVMALSTRVGFELEPYFLHDYSVLPYIRLGVETSKDKLETTYAGEPDVYPYNVASNYQRWPYRALLGIGAEFPTSSLLTLRVEYNYHSKGQVLQTDGRINDGSIINPIFASSINPKIQSVKASVVLNFDT